MSWTRSWTPPVPPPFGAGLIGQTVTTPDGEGVVMDADACDDAANNAVYAWVAVEFPDGSEKFYSPDEVQS